MKILVILFALVCAACQPPFLPAPSRPPEAVETSPTIILADASMPTRISSNSDDDEDPTVVRARDGRFHVVWSSKQKGRVDLFMRSSRDGQKWTDERRLTDGPDENYYPSLLQSRDGAFHLAWYRLQRKAGRMDIWHMRSTDGRQWSKPAQITNQGQDWGPTMYEDGRGVLWIVWSSRRMGNRELFAVRSEDGGKRWSIPYQLTRSAEEDDFPHVIERRGGERLLVWTRYRSGSKVQEFHRDATSEVVMASGRDGLHWSAPLTLSPPDQGARYVDFLPYLFPDSDGQRVYVSWTSSRTGIKGDILARDVGSPSSALVQLTRGEESDYSAKIVPTAQRGEYLMVWVSTREGKADIFAQRFRF